MLAALGNFDSSDKGLRLSIDFWSGIYLVLAFVAISSNITFGLAFAITTESFTRRLRHHSLQNILSQGMSFFDKREYQVAALMGVLTTSAQDLAVMNGPVLGSLVAFVATLTGGIVISLVIGWKLALVCIATIPIVVACGWLRLRTIGSLNTLTRRRGQEAAAYASELVGSVRTVTSLGMQDSVLNHYCSLLQRQWEKSLSSILYGSALYAASQSAVYLCAAMAFWYGGRLLQVREYSLFQFYVCFAAVISGSQQAGIIASSAPDASKAMHATEELMDILAKTPSPQFPDNSDLVNLDLVKEGRMYAHLNVYKVSFRYPSRPEATVLDNITLEALPGQFIALVGPSGCGKSTLISLLERFYNPDNGTILMDGRNIFEFDIENFRRSLGLVSQNSFLYSTTIRENIALGLQNGVATDEDILEACRQANIYDFVSSLP
jgi:ATP-binding cassette subfamily B (MDR/TAP) protein 1